VHEVNVGRRSLADYRSIVPGELMAEIDELADKLKGRRVLHVNATSFGGGVAEILYTLVPLLRDAGLDAHWQVIDAPAPFFTVTKNFHNGLQGQAFEFTREAREIYEEVCKVNAGQVDEGAWDVIVIHDPQPLFMHGCTLPGPKQPRWAWRCHIDTSTPMQELYEYLLPVINCYDAAIYTMREYVPQGLEIPVHEVAPTIDPLTPKNMALAAQDATYIVRQFGIDVERPLLLQVSRFDPWKDPLGVVDAYRMVKRERPEVQLALIGSMASDDPEGWDFLERVIDHAAGDPDVFVLSNLDNVGAVEINAFQSHADVVLQKSTREGFGLTVTEALWKGRPTIGGAVGGIPLQIEDGETGYLVSSAEECARRCLDVLAEPEKHHGMALRGKEHVRREFLTPRLLRDDLRLIAGLLG
jgi:trehalose synthase